jgi:hypothetical protein
MIRFTAAAEGGVATVLHAIVREFTSSLYFVLRDG